jgi:hypothetical protein
MKKIPKAEISTIKEILYPEKKKTNEWNKKNLKNLKEIEEKNKRIREEKKNFISPEPYKIEKFKNIPSKLKSDTKNWIMQEQNKHIILPKTANTEQKRNYSKPKTNQKKNELTPFSNKPSTSINDTRPFYNEINELKEENIYNILNNKQVSMFDKYYANKKNSKLTNNIFDSNMNKNINENINNIEINYNNNFNNQENLNEKLKEKDEAIEKLINEYKEKYGTDEALENMINEYYNKSSKKEIPEINNRANKINYNINDNKIILPKIQKNYIRENRQLIIENKIPLKHKQNGEDLIQNNKHKDYGKVPEYIKKYELERELKKEELKRQEEASKYPKGTKLLSEEERISTLNGLLENKKEITNQLEKMPITTRTNSIRIRKEELLNKLEEIEKAIEMFSKKQVFVKI